MIFIAGLIALLFFNPLAIIWVFFMMFVVNTLMQVFGKKNNENLNAYSENKNKLMLKEKDCVYSFGFVGDKSEKRHILNNFNIVNNLVFKSKCKYDNEMSASDGVSSVLVMVVSIGLYLITALLVVMGKMSVPVMMGTAELTSNISNPLYSLFSYSNDMKSTKTIREKIMELMIMNKEEENSVVLDRLSDCLCLENVSVKYDNNLVLNKANLEFKVNNKYLLVGQSGCGKSTILKLLSKNLYEYDGVIKYDNLDYQSIDTSELYKYLSYVPQETYLLNDTIKNNVTLYKEYDDETLNNIYKKTGLDILLNKEENGDLTIVEEDATNLSGGERQRIAIARALLKGNNILLLDEITSALDNKLSYDIEKMILSLENTLVINVSHKLNEELIKEYDHILFVGKDGIKELDMNMVSIDDINGLLDA